MFSQIENNLHGQGLFILSNIVVGANPEQLKGHIDEIATIIFNDDIMYTYENLRQYQLVCCLKVLSKYQINEVIKFRIFFASISASSLFPELQKQV